MSEGGKSAAIKQMHALSPRSKQLVAQLFSNSTDIHTYTPGKMQKLHKGRYKLIGKVLSSFGQHMNYFNMNDMGLGIFWV